jgi:hypothetical protein
VNEAYLKGRLRKAITTALEGAVVFRHEDQFSSGIPDMSVTWERRTAWVEVKYAPLGRSTGATKLQAYTLDRLRKAGSVSLLVTYRETKRHGKHIIVEGPANGQSRTIQGWDHVELAALLHVDMVVSC